MPTDPYVDGGRDDAPRQEPNLAPGVRVPPAHGWRADRPGDLGPAQPRGPLLGSPGPNVGYALSLTHRAADGFALGPHEHRDDAVAVVGELAMKRASSFGRAPIGADVECAALVLGYAGDPAHEFVAWRTGTVHGAGHEYEVRRGFCDAVPLEELRLTPGSLAPRVAVLQEQLRAS